VPCIVGQQSAGVIEESPGKFELWARCSASALTPNVSVA